MVVNFKRPAHFVCCRVLDKDEVEEAFWVLVVAGDDLSASVISRTLYLHVETRTAVLVVLTDGTHVTGYPEMRQYVPVQEL